jgi:hypothetical protein
MASANGSLAMEAFARFNALETDSEIARQNDFGTF